MKSIEHSRAPLVFPVVVCFFLFFIDEGYYDFRWMKNPGNWIAFALITLFFYAGELLIGSLVLARYHGRYKTGLTVSLGITAGFILWILALGWVNRPML